MQEESLLKENFVIALLINHGKAVYDQIKDEITPKDFKLEHNETIVQKMYQVFEKGPSNIENVDALFTDEECISQITGILAEDFELGDMQKGINDALNSYKRAKLTARKNEIIKMLDNPELDVGAARELEKELSQIIISLAKR